MFSKKKSEKIIDSKDSQMINSNNISESKIENLETFNASEQYLITADNSDIM